MGRVVENRLTLRDVVAALERLYPPDTAQSWDRVGPVAGDPEQSITRIHLAVDPTLAGTEEAKQAGADLIVPHHPLLLRGIHSVPAATAKGAGVAGPADGTVRRVAVLGGAGDSSFEAVRSSGADVYVTADLRHHPALEAREEASLAGGTPYLVDAGHFASESLWLPGLADRLMA